MNLDAGRILRRAVGTIVVLATAAALPYVAARVRESQQAARLASATIPDAELGACRLSERPTLDVLPASNPRESGAALRIVISPSFHDATELMLIGDTLVGHTDIGRLETADDDGSSTHTDLPPDLAARLRRFAERAAESRQARTGTVPSMLDGEHFVLVTAEGCVATHMPMKDSSGARLVDVVIELEALAALDRPATTADTAALRRALNEAARPRYFSVPRR